MTDFLTPSSPPPSGKVAFITEPLGILEKWGGFNSHEIVAPVAVVSKADQYEFFDSLMRLQQALAGRDQRKVDEERALLESLVLERKTAAGKGQGLPEANADLWQNWKHQNPGVFLKINHFYPITFTENEHNHEPENPGL